MPDTLSEVLRAVRLTGAVFFIVVPQGDGHAVSSVPGYPGGILSP
jgi:hypothetical protein